MRNFELKQFLVERDRAIYSFDVQKFKKFYLKWQERGVYNEPLANDEVLEVAMRKMVLALKNPKQKKLAEAKAWLRARGINDEF